MGITGRKHAMFCSTSINLDVATAVDVCTAYCTMINPIYRFLKNLESNIRLIPPAVTVE